MDVEGEWFNSIQYINEYDTWLISLIIIKIIIITMKPWYDDDKNNLLLLCKHSVKNILAEQNFSIDWKRHVMLIGDLDFFLIFQFWPSTHFWISWFLICGCWIFPYSVFLPVLNFSISIVVQVKFFYNAHQKLLRNRFFVNKNSSSIS